MIREAIATGATVEEAKENACKELGVETYDDRIDFEIIEMQSKKVLGLFGGHPAKVKVILKQSAAQAPMPMAAPCRMLLFAPQFSRNEQWRTV